MIVTLVVLLCSLAASIMMLSSQSIRLDEAQSIWVATKPIATILSLTSQDVHVPLYFLIQHVWIQLFGTEITVVRIPSLLFFIGTLPVLYLLAREAGSRGIALLTVTFFSASPFIVWFTSEARMYTLFTLVTTINHLFFLRVVKSHGSCSKFGYFVSLLLGFYTHYFFLFLLVTQLVFVFLRFGRNPSASPRTVPYGASLRVNQSDALSLKTLLLGVGTPLLFAGMLFLPWIGYVVKSGFASSTQPVIPTPTSFNVFQTFVNFLFGFQTQGMQALLVSLWPFSVIVFFFIFTRRQKIPIRDFEYFVLVTFLPIFLVFFASFFKPLFLSRYLIFVTPTLFFILAYLVLSYSRRVSSYVVATLLIIMLGLLVYQSNSRDTPVKEDYRGVATYLSANVSPSDIIAVSAPFTVYPIEYSYVGQARIVTIPEWNRYVRGSIPVFSMKKLEQQTEKYRRQYARIFTVLSYDQGYEKDLRTYFDQHYELLAHKQFSPGLEIRVYRLRYDVPIEKPELSSGRS